MNKEYTDKLVNDWYVKNAVTIDGDGKVEMIVGLDKEEYVSTEKPSEYDNLSIVDVGLEKITGYVYGYPMPDNKNTSVENLTSRFSCAFEMFNADLDDRCISGVKVIFFNKSFTKDSDIHIISTKSIKRKEDVHENKYIKINRVIVDVNTHVSDVVEDPLSYNINVDEIHETSEGNVGKRKLNPMYRKNYRSKSKR